MNFAKFDIRTEGCLTTPRAAAVAGIPFAVLLITSLAFFYWAPLVFPSWVLLISVHLLLSNLSLPEGEIPEQA